MIDPDSISTSPPAVAPAGVSTTVKVEVPDSVHRSSVRNSDPYHSDSVSNNGRAEVQPVTAVRQIAQTKSVNLSKLGPFYKDYEIKRVTSDRVVAQHKADSIASDSVAADTVRVEHTYGILLTAPRQPEVAQREQSSDGMSYIFGGLILLFCIIGIRFHNSRKYVSALLRNLIEVRVRSNVFDETVRETSFLVLLNFMWGCSAGILIYGLLCESLPSNPFYSFGVPGLASHKAAAVGICMGVGVAYTCFMSLAYYVVGCVFSDGVHARMWLKGFTASQGLMSFIYFPVALLLLCWREWTPILLWIGFGTFILAKMAFIWKGFRIFFTQFSSWVLFLYYLCSLEIVPLILTYLAALWLCSFLH